MERGRRVGLHFLVELGHHEALDDSDQHLLMIKAQVMLLYEVVEHVTVTELVEQALGVELDHLTPGFRHFCRLSPLPFESRRTFEGRTPRPSTGSLSERHDSQQSCLPWRFSLRLVAQNRCSRGESRRLRRSLRSRLLHLRRLSASATESAVTTATPVTSTTGPFRCPARHGPGSIMTAPASVVPAIRR